MSASIASPFDQGNADQIQAGQDTVAKLPAQASPPVGLAALEARVRQDLAWLELPAKAWTVQHTLDGQPVLDVAIIGGGMAGSAAAAALKHVGVKAVVFDRSPMGFEGPWATTARMETLRSPKQLTGPALGLPALTFRAWFESQFGVQAWDALDKIPRLQWMEYLRWYRHVLQLDVRNQHKVTSVKPGKDLVQLEMDTPEGAITVFARRVVLATGRDGLGAGWAPDYAWALPRDRWAHSSDVLDYATLAGKRVGVIGAGSSAMDSAATALESGAARVDLLVRRSDLPRINKGKGAGSPGMTFGYPMLSDEWRWRIRHYINVQQVPPPRGSTMRVSRNPNAHFQLGYAARNAHMQNDEIVVETSRGNFAFDFLVFATGFRTNWERRPEFAALAPHIRLWSDRFTPEASEADQELAESPDLGPAFEFLPRDPDACPGLSRVHCFCWPAAGTHGAVSGDIPAVSDGAKKLAQGLAGLLFGEDIDTHFARMQAWDDPELLGDEWVPSDVPPPAVKGAS